MLQVGATQAQPFVQRLGRLEHRVGAQGLAQIPQQDLARRQQLALEQGTSNLAGRFVIGFDIAGMCCRYRRKGLGRLAEQHAHQLGA